MERRTRIPRTARRVVACGLLLAAAVAARAAASQAPAQAGRGEITLNLDAAKSKLSWTLGSTLHTVHGTFNLKSGTMQFDPANGNASGEFIAYATSGESGNDGRDKKMHKEILESARYPDIVFRPDKIEGTLTPQGTCNVQLHGTLLLHGSGHEITVSVQAELSENSWKGSAKFSIPYVAWGLKSPNTFLLKADPEVQIDLDMSGSLQRVSAQ